MLFSRFCGTMAICILLIAGSTVISNAACTDQPAAKKFEKVTKGLDQEGIPVGPILPDVPYCHDDGVCYAMVGTEESFQLQTMDCKLELLQDPMSDQLEYVRSCQAITNSLAGGDSNTNHDVIIEMFKFAKENGSAKLDYRGITITIEPVENFLQCNFLVSN